MRFESILWAAMFAVAALGLVREESGEAAADGTADRDRARIVERFDAPALELRHLTGSLEIESGAWNRIEVVLEGQRSALEAVSRQIEGEVLVIDAGAVQSDHANSSTVIGSVSVITTGGGSSQVIIGGKNLSAERSVASSRIKTRVRVPRGLPLKVLGHQGDVVSGDHKGPLVLDLIAGAAELGEIRDARLSLTGAGSIAAREAFGNLSIAVTGSGQVRISTSLLEHLEVGVTGEGAVDVEGEARYASLSLIGSGRIYLAEAERQPLVAQIGAGEIVIGSR